MSAPAVMADAADLADRGYATVEPDVYQPDPDRPGYRLLERIKTIGEMHEELRAIVGSESQHGWEPSLEGLNEYFSCIGDSTEAWPIDSRIVVFAVRGGSEGDYVHVEAIAPSGRATCLILGKGFAGRQAAWEAAKVLADLLGV